MSRLGRYFSAEALKRSMKLVVRRFACPFVFVCLFALWLLGVIYDAFGNMPDQVIESVAWPFCEGFMLSLAVCLWSEFAGSERLKRISLAAVVLLVLVDFFFIIDRGGIGGQSESIGRVAFFSALTAAVLFLPTVRRLGRKELWNYTLLQVEALLTALFILFVMAIACAVIFSTLELLFGLDTYKILKAAMAVFCMWLPCVYYLSRIPGPKDINSEPLPVGMMIGALCKNVLLPLVAIYTLILYVYAAKILFTWTLPNASVAWMVTGLVLSTLLVLYGLQVYTYVDNSPERARKVASAARQWFPLLLIPLLVLMSVGLIYRIGEYGPTASRLYVAVFNVWAYAIAFYMVVRKNANLNIVAVSFAVVFAAVSMIPDFNLTSINNRMMRSEIRKTLFAKGVTELPVDETRIKEIIAEMPEKEGRNLASRIEYLDDWDDHSQIADIILPLPDTRFSTWRLLPDDYDVVVDTDMLFSLDIDGCVEIPAGYSSVRHSGYFNEKLQPGSDGTCYIQLSDYETRINVDSLFCVKEGFTPVGLTGRDGIDGDTAIIIVTGMTVDADSMAHINDYYIFTK